MPFDFRKISGQREYPVKFTLGDEGDDNPHYGEKAVEMTLQRIGIHCYRNGDQSVGIIDVKTRHGNFGLRLLPDEAHIIDIQGEFDDTPAIYRVTFRE